MCLSGEDFDNRITDFCMQEVVIDAEGFCEYTLGVLRGYVKPAHVCERVDLQVHSGRSEEPRRKKKTATIKTDSQLDGIEVSISQLKAEFEELNMDTEVGSLFDGIETALSQLKARLEELKMRCSRNSAGPVEKCIRDSSIDESRGRKIDGEERFEELLFHRAEHVHQGKAQ